MTPNQFAGALRAFAQASRHSPDPAASVADLAELIAQAVDEGTTASERVPQSVGDHDELAFPPIDPADQAPDPHAVAEAAREALGVTAEEWAGLEEVERGQRIAQHTAAA